VSHSETAAFQTERIVCFLLIADSYIDLPDDVPAVPNKKKPQTLPLGAWRGNDETHSEMRQPLLLLALTVLRRSLHYLFGCGVVRK
jgi:hypothetical protein